MASSEIPGHLHHRLTLLVGDDEEKIQDILNRKDYHNRDEEGKARFSAWVDEELDEREREEFYRQSL